MCCSDKINDFSVVLHNVVLSWQKKKAAFFFSVGPEDRREVEQCSPVATSRRRPGVRGNSMLWPCPLSYGEVAIIISLEEAEFI